MLKNYKNEPFTNFSIEENKNAMSNALSMVDLLKGKEYPLVIGNDKIFTDSKISSLNPSNHKEIIGYVSNANVEHAEKAVQLATEAYESWRKVDAVKRANYIFNAAAIIRRRKHEFSAWLIEESGKSWAEADADTAEAIDFLEYYGRQMLRMDKGVDVLPMEGENNECIYTPIGVGVVISPWNFPFAILAGMTASAIVTGNTVIMKPASATPVIAAKFMEVWEEIGLPSGVVNYLPGPGASVGDYLVTHPKVRFLNFTGSREVGLRINKLAADVVPGQKWIKKVIAEMGGKDAIIVDSEADLDSAADGIVASAFGFQGQKCSACSRAIIVEDVYDTIVEKVCDRVKKIKQGPAKDNSNYMGPVIEKNAYDKIMNYIEIGKTEGKLVAGGKGNNIEGYYIEPTIFIDIDCSSRIAQEEIFGPVLALIKANDFDEALEIVNGTDYGLTGAIYSKNREKLEKCRLDFHVGNLYYNRKCTGALVGVNPFGGFNMSGTDSKAGGPDYLSLFMQLKSITERY